MITLAGIVLNSNLYIEGVTQARKVVYKQERTVEGESVLTVVPTPGGRNLILSTTNVNGARQGIWCQHMLDQLKQIEEVGSTVILDYNGDTYNVKIVDTTQLTQLHQFEPVGPNKQYTGKILTIEV